MPYIWLVVETESCMFVEKIVSILHRHDNYHYWNSPMNKSSSMK